MKSIGEIAERADWFADERVTDKAGPCAECGKPCTLSAFAIACAMHCNAILRRRKKPPLTATEIAICADCYGRSRMDRQGEPAGPQTLSDWRGAYDQ